MVLHIAPIRRSLIPPIPGTIYSKGGSDNQRHTHVCMVTYLYLTITGNGMYRVDLQHLIDYTITRLARELYRPTCACESILLCQVKQCRVA